MMTSRDKLGGTALIVGVIMGLTTMMLHPTGHDIQRDPVFQVALNIAVHSLAILAAPISFYGGFVLSRRLSAASPLAELALVFYGVSAVATMMAATASGLLAPALIANLQSSNPEMSTGALALLRYNSALNQAFAKIIVGMSSLAIGLWSFVIVKWRLLGRRTGIYGCVVAVISLLALLSGQLRLDIHGFGAIVLAHGVWLVVMGMDLRRTAVE